MNEDFLLEKKILESGIAKLDLELSMIQIDQLIKYIRLLIKWNKVYNLTAITETSRIITHHLLDGLTIIRHLGCATNIIDVGSGMGVPGIIIAICRPEIKVTLIDSKLKKATFLRQVAIELKLTNLNVVNLPVENYVPKIKFDLAISRAFANIMLFIQLTKHLLMDKAVILAMKSQSIKLELDDISKVDKYKYVIIPLKIPGIEDERYLLKLDM